MINAEVSTLALAFTKYCVSIALTEPMFTISALAPVELMLMISAVAFTENIYDCHFRISTANFLWIQ